MTRPYPAILLALAGAPFAHAADIPVASASDINAALASIQPGDTLVMADGLWTNQVIRFETDGTPAQPITLRAQTPGGVTLNGSSRLEIEGDHLVVEGLRFEGGALTTGHIVRFMPGTTHSVLRDTAIIDYNPPSIATRYFWVSLYGTDNTVENCRFENQNHSGVTVCVWGDWPNRHTIRNNHFVDRPAGPENGWETIRLGTSDFVTDSSETVIESNLFERTDGEIEAISVKTGNNIIRYNTFKEMAATVTLRHGFAATVQGNFFLGEGLNESGGVRVIGPDHRVYNNYFERVGGRTDGIIALEAGEPNAANSGYQPVDNVIVAHNTFVDCEAPALILDRSFGSGNRTVLPTNVTIAGNLISAPAEPVAIGTDNNLSWIDNLAFAASLNSAPASGATLLSTDPLALADDGLQRPAPAGPADNAASTTFPFLTDDMDGHARSTTPDVGADEISTAPTTRGPLLPEQVGPSWWDHSGNAGVDASLGLAVEAETAQIQDPDSDGAVFTVVSDAAASAGRALVAPPGSRTDVPANPHDTLAVFTLRFPAPGTYTAYYRARGFSGSSDSFYTPSDFDTDPQTTETTSNNGVFTWETGTTFTITSPDTPREFRIGRREGDTQIDAVVFHPEPALTPAQLDFVLANAPIANCAVDYDHDGVASYLDTIAYLRLFDAGDPAANLGGSSNLDVVDLARHLQALEGGCR